MTSDDPLQRIRAQFAARRDRLKQVATDAEATVRTGQQMIEAWRDPVRTLAADLQPRLQDSLRDLKARNAEPANLKALEDEIQRWKKLGDDARIRQVDAQNGALQRKLTALRAQRGIRGIGRTLFGASNNTGDDADSSSKREGDNA